MSMPTLGTQILWLLVLAIPIASISWTITHEEIFREFREAAARLGEHAGNVAVRKVCYLVSCEYCFSHWVTVLILLLTNFRLLMPDWRGLVIAGFALSWIANQYMALFFRLRLDIKAEGVAVKVKERELGQDSPEPSP